MYAYVPIHRSVRSIIDQEDHAKSNVWNVLKYFVTAAARCCNLTHAFVGNIAGFGHAVAKSDDRRA